MSTGAVSPRLLLLFPYDFELILLLFDELILVSEIGIRQDQMLNNVFDLIGIVILKLTLHQRQLHPLLIHFFLILNIEFMCHFAKFMFQLLNFGVHIF